MINKYFWVIIVILIIVAFLYTNNDKNSSKTKQASLPSSSDTFENSPDTVDVTLSILNALNYYYAASVEPADENGDFAKTMTSMLSQIKYLETGNSMIKKYINNPNEVIKLATGGMTIGAEQAIKANNEMVQSIRTMDFTNPKALQELDYTIAKYTSDQKEGYKTIVISAPQIGYLIFEPAKSEKPTGKIPYRITKEERKRLLNEIERLFGDNLRIYPNGYDSKTQNYNSILVAVSAIQKYLIPDTYEESEKLNVNTR